MGVETGFEEGSPTLAYGTADVLDSSRTTTSDIKLRFDTVQETEYGSLAAGFQVGAAAGNEYNEVELDQAYIDFGPLRAGLRPSFFDFSTGYSFTDGFASDLDTNLVAGLWAIRPGLDVALSIEEPRFRRVEDGAWADYGGASMPDLVLAIRKRSDGGTFHVAGALHQIADLRRSEADRLGWALSAGLELEIRSLPSTLMLAGAVSEGALSYLGIPFLVSDYVFSQNGPLDLTRGFSALLSYQRNWGPRLRTPVTVSLYRTRTEADAFDWETRGLRASVGVEFEPVEGLEIGIEGTYQRDSVKAETSIASAPRVTTDGLAGIVYVRSQF